MHRADRAVHDVLAHQAGFLAGLAVVAQLRGHSGTASGLGHHASFLDRVGQRLLAVDVLALIDGGQG